MYSQQSVNTQQMCVSATSWASVSKRHTRAVSIRTHEYDPVVS